MKVARSAKILLVLFACFIAFGTLPARAVSQELICNSDINQDGSVNLTDYRLFTDNFLDNPFSNQRTDINRDTLVNLSDYLIFVSAFLQNCPKPSATPVPVSGAGHYYVSTTGSDANAGTATSPFKTIQKAVNTTKTDSSNGATIHIMPGIYRESVLFDSVHGTNSDPIIIKAENGPNTVYIYGSQNSGDSRITWTKSAVGETFPNGVASHIYSADLSAWGATPEIAYNITNGSVRLPKAHEPDFEVTTEWKYHENFWTADGADGTSFNTLVDATNDPVDSYPLAGQLQGNLKSINGLSGSFLTGARLFFKDGDDGHDFYNTLITAHDGSLGKITFDRQIEHPKGKAAATKYTKYFIEGASELLDTPGEWYYNAASKKIYIWTPGDVNPVALKLEFATRMNAISIKNSTYLTFKDLNLDYTNSAYALSTGPDGAVRFYGYSTDQTHHITFDGLRIEHNGVGMRLYQSNESTSSSGTIHDVTLKNSVINDSDSYALVVWHYPVPAPAAFIHHLWFENNEFGHMGFRGPGVGIFMQHPEKLVFINNYLHHSGHNSIEIQGGKSSGNTLALVQNNLSESNCYNGADCGAFKFYHAAGGTGMRNILVLNNIFRGTKGWTYANSAQKEHNSPLGYGYWGNGYYSDVIMSSTPGQGCAVTLYRNLIYDNTAGGIHLTRSRDHCAFNNVMMQNGFGIEMNNYAPTTDGSFYNKIIGNILFSIEPTNSSGSKIYGITSRINKADEGRLTVDKNIYRLSGTNSYDMFKQDVTYSNVATWKTVSDVRAGSPWEEAGKDMTQSMPALPTGQSADISVYEKALGVTSVSIPPEMAGTIDALQKEFGVTIPNSSVVGRR